MFGSLWWKPVIRSVPERVSGPGPLRVGPESGTFQNRKPSEGFGTVPLTLCLCHMFSWAGEAA